MTTPRVLVIYKKSQYQLLVEEAQNPQIARLIDDADPSVAHLIHSHERHQQTFGRVREQLSELSKAVEYRPLNEPGASVGFDLVVTLGGDGTLLWASHIVGPGLPMLAINTSPETSVGYLCGGTAETLETVLPAAVRPDPNGALPATELSRMEVVVDGTRVSSRVLNDALFTAACPAATTRYFIFDPDAEDESPEEQRSSGIWVGPAAGSTAAQRSAGGDVLPIDSPDLQFVVREPYAPPGITYHVTKGTIPETREFRVQSKTPDGRLFLDGPHREHVVQFGAQVVMRRSPQSLTLLNLSRPGKSGFEEPETSE